MQATRSLHVPPAIAILETPTSCAGAATSYALRTIAYAAGAFAPGIQDALFHEVHAVQHGSSLAAVGLWIASRSSTLDELGYRLRFRFSTMRTPELGDWIEEGRGYRAAVVATAYEYLHPSRASTELAGAIYHAVAVTYRGVGDRATGVYVVDPWSPGRPATTSFSPELELARAERDYQALTLFWYGWS